MSLKKICLVFSLFFLYKCTDLNIHAPTKNDLSGIQCGKKEPKKDTDCSKYGTDSGMYCCYVEGHADFPGSSCVLISRKKAKEYEMEDGKDGKFKFADGSTWSCGNNSVYLKFNLALFIIVITLLI